MALPGKVSSAIERLPMLENGSSDDVQPQAHHDSIDEVMAENAATISLTKALMQSSPNEFIAATQAPFLRAAGQGMLSKTMLSIWLSQDRLYAETYVCFISSLISRISLPYGFVSNKSKSLRWRILKLLTAAFDNIHRELDFFAATAEQYGLDLSCVAEDQGGQVEAFMPAHATQQYMDLFRSFFNDPSLPLVEGLVVLWATEQCYLSAWKYARSCMQDGSPASDADGGALRKAFMPNWTSNEFEEFVDEIANVTDLLADRENAIEKLPVYKAVWSHVLDIETRFWPDV